MNCARLAPIADDDHNPQASAPHGPDNDFTRASAMPTGDVGTSALVQDIALYHAAWYRGWTSHGGSCIAHYCFGILAAGARGRIATGDSLYLCASTYYCQGAAV